MKVESLMTKKVHTCGANEPLRRAAQIMWEHDCGCVPVVDDAGRVTGIITDRDGFIGAYVRGRSLDEIPVQSAMAKDVVTCHPDDDLDDAERKLRAAQVRRLPVVNGEGALVGLLSLSDIARRTKPGPARALDGLSGDALALTVAAISMPRDDAPR